MPSLAVKVNAFRATVVSLITTLNWHDHVFHAFCTYFDHRYFPRGLAIIAAVREDDFHAMTLRHASHCAPGHFYWYCFRA